MQDFEYRIQIQMFHKDYILFNQQKFHSDTKTPFNLKKIKSSNIIYKSKKSTVYSDQEYIIKLITVQKYFRDTLRSLRKKSKTHDEILGNMRLSELDIKVPKLHFFGRSFGAKKHNEIIILERMNSFTTVKEFILNSSDQIKNTEIICNVAQDLKTMIENDIYFRDFHFENVMTNKKGEICWIDTGISIINCKERMKFKINKKLNVLDFHIKKDCWLQEQQWSLFKNLVIEAV